MINRSGKALTVFEVTTHIKSLLESDEILSGVWVEGEVSNLVKAASGHQYFTLKDEKATLKAALWAGKRQKIAVELKNGLKVMAFGNISVYEPRGEYQISVSDLKPAGLGALFEAFEKLKAKLSQEGLFDPARKIPLPFLPKGIGIVTSPKGAVIQDIFRVIRRRFPNMPLYLVPVKVQGDGASQEIAAGIRRLDLDPRVDVIIVARGGGSLEDLWAFNEEVTARAIAAAVKPIVSAVGHETDVTIADFVADKRAATPSVAGELVVPVKAELVKSIQLIKNRLEKGLRNQLALARGRLARATSCRFLRRPDLWIAERRLQLANVTRDLENSSRQFFRSCRHAFDLLFSQLRSLSPQAVLRRGFLMATGEAGHVITRLGQLQTGQNLTLHFADGKAATTVSRLWPVDEMKG